MLIKLYGQPKGPHGSAERKYSPSECIGTRTKVIEGKPDPKQVSTSYAERQNLTMRMSMRRFTRLTNAFSKKFENHCHSLALYFVWYNWIRKHKAHDNKKTPAMAAGLTDKAMSMADVVQLIDTHEQDLIFDRRKRQLSYAN